MRVDVPGLVRRIDERRKDDAFMRRLAAALERESDILARLSDAPRVLLCSACGGDGEAAVGVECGRCQGYGLVAVEG